MFFLLVPLALCHPGLRAIGTAEAHPGTSQLGQRFEVTIERSADGVVQADLLYVAEVPAVRIYAEARPYAAASPVALARDAMVPAEVVQAYTKSRLTELTEGIRASWDGQSLPLTDVAEGTAVVEAAGGFLEFHVHKLAALPSDVGTLQLHDRNFPDEEGYYATSVSLSGDLVVTETSLCGVKDGLVHKNKHGAWVRDTSARETTVSIRPATYWERRDGLLPLPERLAGLASLEPPTTALSAAAAVTVALVAGGAYAGLRASRRSARASHRSVAAPTDPS